MPIIAAVMYYHKWKRSGERAKTHWRSGLPARNLVPQRSRQGVA
jgi:hypothetical protein